MIITRFQDLKRKKALEEKRDLSLRQIAKETGLSYATVQRVSSGNAQQVYLSTLDTLCIYFKVNSISELVEFVEPAE